MTPSRRRFVAVIAAPLAAVVCMTAPAGAGARAAESGGGAAQAPYFTLQATEEAALTVVETTTGWCIRGATFAVLFSAAFSVPTMLLGGGAPYTAMRAGTAALMGCGVAVTWRTAARGVAYVDGIINPLPPVPADPPPRPVPAFTRPALIHTSG